MLYNLILIKNFKINIPSLKTYINIYHCGHLQMTIEHIQLLLSKWKKQDTVSFASEDI